MVLTLICICLIIFLLFRDLNLKVMVGICHLVVVLSWPLAYKQNWDHLLFVVNTLEKCALIKILQIFKIV